MFELRDSGTLDTLIVNVRTGEEHFFNYQYSGFEGTYEEFVADCITQLESDIEITVTVTPV